MKITKRNYTMFPDKLSRDEALCQEFAWFATIIA